MRKPCIAATISAAGRPIRRGTGVCTEAPVEWQPLHELAPGGRSAARVGVVIAANKKIVIPAKANAGIHLSGCDGAEGWVPAFAGTTLLF